MKQQKGPTTFDEFLDARPALVADGGMGTSLFALGLQNGHSPELLNVEAPSIVETAHAGFVEAGADILLTNTFGANRRRLALHDLESRVRELNAAAVAVARHAAEGARRPIAIAGSIGPTGDLLEPVGPLTHDEAAAVFREQASALADAGADVLWIETMSSLEELTAAFTATAGLGLPVAATMSFDTHGKTMMGVAPAQLASWSLPSLVRPFAVGANCGIGPGDVLAAVHEITATDREAVVIAKANAGIPAYTSEGGLTYPITDGDMADYATLALATGARIVGACCGATPAHLAAIRRAVDAYEPASRPQRDEIAARFGSTASSAPIRRTPRPRRRTERRSA